MPEETKGQCFDLYNKPVRLIQELLDYRKTEDNMAGGPESPFKLAMNASPDPDVTE